MAIVEVWRSRAVNQGVGAASALNDGSGISVRRISCQRFGELKGRFGRAIQFLGVTKLGCRNGALAWASEAVRAVRSH
jgi:hypothetical protein